MKTISLQITYRKGKPFAAYIYLSSHAGQKVGTTEELAPGLVVDFGTDETPIGIEVVSPGFVTSSDLTRLFHELGLEIPDPRDLEPLLAA